jgi:hypothetical protein
MFRLLLLAFLGFVVIWDLVTTGPEDAAVTRASIELGRWTREELERHRLIDRASEALEAFRNRERTALPAPSRPPAAGTIVAEALADVAVPAGVSPRPALAVHDVGDSVFAKGAILAFAAEASARTGVSADYLEQLALRESSFNPVAASDSSTARGLYQFIESTWLEVFARHGAEHDQGDLAALVTTSVDGRPEVADARARRRILDLRYDPKLATFLAAQLARDNRASLEAALGRKVSDAELYIAHFLGRSGAETLFAALESSPEASAADLFPWAAPANRRYFYGRRNREKTVAELYDALLLQARPLEQGSTVAVLASGAS